MTGKGDCLDQEFKEARDALAVSDVSFQVLTDAMPQMVWSTRADGYHDYYNARWYEFTGVASGTTDGDGWAEMFHPSDLPLAGERWQHSLRTGTPYEVEYRLRHRSGEYRWTIGRANPIRDDAGNIIRWIGTCTDIHEAKVIGEQNELLSRELSHRIKNIFAVVTGLIGMMGRQFPEGKAFASALRDRVAALGRAHEFVRPHSEESRPTIERTTVRGLCADLFKPYPASSEGRISIHGADLVVDDRGATPLSLVFHELATNAAKYGSLSVENGRVDITIAPDSVMGARIEWRESGGPALSGPPAKPGFGSRLVEISVLRQLGGQLEWTWSPAGLLVTIRLHPSRLARGEIAKA